LGGSAWKTWSWERDVANFWPQWLPEDIQFASFRISTFGYNANFKGAASNLDIVDFAKDLLLQLYTTIGQSDSYDGPVIFVAHSMGGLIVKKAYILGKHDKQYSDLIARVFGIVFLATPHRGSHFAKILNNILSAAPLGAPPKHYVADLDKQSSSINDINVSFSQCCQELSLVSFYETLKTSVHFTRVLVVEKDSAVLGYPNEVSASLDADHHTACKFRDRMDPNFIKVQGMLRTWLLRQTQPERPALLARETTYAETLRKAQLILGIQDPGDADNNLEVFRSLATGFGRWLPERDAFSAWVGRPMEGETAPLAFWLVGLPGKGKTVLCASIIDHLQKQEKDVQYHLFSEGHQNRRTTAYCLRSLAAQLARKHAAFREALVAFHEETGIAFKSETLSFQYLWDRIFVGILFKLELDEPLWWVLDGIDEADYPSAMVTSLNSIRSRTQIKIYLSSRPHKALATFDKSRLTSYFLQDSDTALDVRAYAETAVRNEIPHDTVLQHYVLDQILQKASGSFLWVRLALETLENNWYTREAIKAALTSVPRSMVAMYRRMIGEINKQQSRTRDMAKLILTWTACSWRPLSLDEMKAALEAEFKDLTTNLTLTINQICGHFTNLEHSKGTTANDKTRVTLIHATAREFLLQGAEGEAPFINQKDAHKILAIRCLTYLSHDRWKQHYSSVHMAISMSNKANLRKNSHVFDNPSSPLLGYATYYWAYHASKAPTGASDLVKAMNLFFVKYCLSWIEGVALSGNLQYLSRAAQYLKVYVKRATRRRSITDEDVEMAKSLVSLKDSQDDYDWIQGWAVDLIRVVGKFGSNLLRNPPSIYRHVPAFCPKESMMGKTYGNMQSRLLTVEGLPSETWDDCLASVNVGREGWACSQVLATEAFFLTLANASGTVLVWTADTFEKAKTICQGEWVTMMALNRGGTMLATAGYKTFCIWELATGRRLHCFPRTSSAKVLDVKFGPNDEQLLVGLDNCTVAYHKLETGHVEKLFVARLPQDDRGYVGCPGNVAISPDLTKVAMSWRGRVPLVWELNHAQPLPPYSCRVKGPNDQLLYPTQLCWQPETGSLLVLCATMRLVEWRILDEYQIEYDHIGGQDMIVSDDGNFLLSRDHHNTLSIWTFPRLSLVYRLLNTNDPSSAMVFSPNCQRFYDIRGPICNAWEPDALVRPDEQDLEDNSSTGESFALTEPITAATGGDHILITAMSLTSSEKYFCYGREDGSVVIVDAYSGKRLRKVFSHGNGVAGDVLTLSWSKSGRYIASCDEFSQVIVKRLQPKEDGKWAVFPVFEMTLRDRALQFLFSTDEKLLLISTPTDDSIWDLKTKKQLIRHDWGAPQSRCWAQHPAKPDMLIWVEPSLIRTFTWPALEQQRVVKCSSNRPESISTTSGHFTKGSSGGLMPPTTSRDGDVRQGTTTDTASDTPRPRRPSFSSNANEQKRSVQWVSAVTERNEHYLVYATTGEDRSVLWATELSHNGLKIHIIALSDLDSAIANDGARHMPLSLVSHMKLLVGVLGSKIVFLDHEGWLATWDITAASASPDNGPAAHISNLSGRHECDIDGADGLTEHFFAPRDWLNNSTSHLAVVDDKGTLFVPKYGDVAIVRGGMRI
jgi:WD40 repeat protein